MQWPWVSALYGEEVRTDLGLEEGLHVEAAFGELAASAWPASHAQPTHASLFLFFDVARVLVLVHRHVVHVLVLLAVPGLVHRTVLPDERSPLVNASRTHEAVSARMSHHLRKRLIISAVCRYSIPAN